MVNLSFFKGGNHLKAFLDKIKTFLLLESKFPEFFKTNPIFSSGHIGCQNSLPT